MARYVAQFNVLLIHNYMVVDKANYLFARGFF